MASRRNGCLFGGQFRRIAEDSEMDDVDEYHYLVTYTESGSPAREVVERFLPRGESFKEAFDELRHRFAKEKTLIRVYVRELIAWVLQQVTIDKSKLFLSKLYNHLRSQLRALETLGVTKDKFAAILLPLVRSTMPEEILKLWERSKHYSQLKNSGAHGRPNREYEEEDELEVFMNFLRDEVEGEELVQEAHSAFGLENYVKRPKARTVVEIPTTTAAALVATEPENQKRPCIFCEKGNHLSQDCFMAQNCTMSEKQKQLEKKGGCFRCLRQGHLANSCRSQVQCQLCQQKHFTMMCKEFFSIKEKWKMNTQEKGKERSKDKPKKEADSMDNNSCFAGTAQSGGLSSNTFGTDKRGQRGVRRQSFT